MFTLELDGPSQYEALQGMSPQKPNPDNATNQSEWIASDIHDKIMAELSASITIAEGQAILDNAADVRGLLNGGLDNFETFTEAISGM